MVGMPVGMNVRRAALPLTIKTTFVLIHCAGVVPPVTGWFSAGAFFGRRNKPVNRLERHPLIVRFSPGYRVSAHFAVGNLHLVISPKVRPSRYLRYSIVPSIANTWRRVKRCGGFWDEYQSIVENSRNGNALLIRTIGL
jgi:hypothetical protein